MASHVALSRGALEWEGTLWFGVEGDSMKPFLRSGDRVLVQTCSIDALQCGDLVLFTKGEALCLHRVMARITRGGHRGLRTKGDGCARWDQPVPADSIVGKGIALERWDRIVALNTIHGRLLGLLCVCGSVLMGCGLWLKWRLQH